MTDASIATPGSKDPLRSTRYVLAGLCCGVFIVMLLVLAQKVRMEPLRPLRDVGITAILVCAMFALCLVSVAIFARMRGEAERRRNGERR